MPIEMKDHDWFDEHILEVSKLSYKFDGCRIFQLDESVLNEGLFISKEDVIALAKDFGLVVYEENSNL